MYGQSTIKLVLSPPKSYRAIESTYAGYIVPHRAWRDASTLLSEKFVDMPQGKICVSSRMSLIQLLSRGCCSSATHSSILASNHAETESWQGL